MTKNERQRQKDEYVDKLGQEHQIFLDHDRDALVRLAFADWNFKHPNKAFNDETISKIVERADSEELPDGAMALFCINNPMSRRRGLHRLLGKDLYALVARDATLFGRLVKFCQAVQLEHICEW